MRTVSIVGPPNAGKSTLFNKLVKRKIATVFDKPGVTRDRKEARGSIGDMEFIVTDTGGWEADIPFCNEIKRQIEKSVDASSVVLMVIDGKNPTTRINDEFTSWILRYSSKPVILVVNKCEGKQKDNLELPKGRFTDIVYISAEHNLGMIDLCEAIAPFIDLPESMPQKNVKPHIKVAIVGRPNAGKSTLLNGIIGTERLITSSSAGTTRDPIDINLVHNGTEFLLIDTAGIRKKANITDQLERTFVEHSIESIRRSDIAILVLDVTLGIEHQDLAIAKIANDEYKGLIVLVNKCDLLKKKHSDNTTLDVIYRSLSKIAKDTIAIPIAAVNNDECLSVLDTCVDLHTKMSKKLGTHSLNKWLRSAIAQQLPPKISHNKFIKFKYITQVGQSPSSFVIFCNSENVDEPYQRYLASSLKKEFHLEGAPIKFTYKKTENPYKDRK